MKKYAFPLMALTLMTMDATSAQSSFQQSSFKEQAAFQQQLQQQLQQIQMQIKQLQAENKQLRLNQVQVGTVSAFAQGTIPDGWLECDGALLASEDYPDLFDAIAHLYEAAGNPTDPQHFKLPDLRGEFLRGYSHDRSGVDVERHLGSAQKSTRIRSLIDAYGSSETVLAVGAWEVDSYNAVGMTASGLTTYTALADHLYYQNSDNMVLSGAGDNTPFTTRPRNVAMKFAIKY